MQPSVKPALETLDKAVSRLEGAIDKKLATVLTAKAQPELALSRDEREINKRIASRLDQTINRLETLLTED